MLAFLHTADVHVPHFTRLVRELDEAVPIVHCVREDLLAQAIADGRVTDPTRQQTQAEVKRLAQGGARVVLCTCSSLGDAAEATDYPGARVLRVDRPMAERALSLSRPILVVATTPTALSSAITLLISASAPAAPVVRELLCSAAWERFQAGDEAGYATALAQQVSAHALPGEVILLAQASMAPAAALIRRADVEVLTSPSLGVQRALSLLGE